uniref:TGF-beta family profile domain-containing protein n=1 Tax=Xiphophorus maculatus TaxID=8083 RepID=A0A3B5QH46_XIPMA
MPAGALRLSLCLLLAALHLSCVPGGAPDEAPFELKDFPRAPAFSPHKKAPQFMLDLFNAVSVADGAHRSQKEILEGNTVRSFQDKGERKHIYYGFIVFYKFTEKKIMHLFIYKEDFCIERHRCRWVDVYEAPDSRLKPQRGNLITSRLVPLYTQGWEVFNVTQLVSKWIQKSQENNGILVVTTFPSSDRMNSEPKQLQLTDTNAYLVVFSDDGRTEANRSYLGKLIWGNSPRPFTSVATRRRRASSDFPLRGRPQSCRRVPLFVDFDEIGWSGWIISPRGYNAYHCKGSCPFPLGVGLRATNHATVRSIMHTLKLPGEDVGAPCCVPDRLQSISLLYFDDEENVVLKQYDDMVALSCGCH